MPQFVAPTPGQPGVPPVQQPAPTPATGDGPDGFPVNTPVAEMTPTQQAAYWKTQARKHEDRVKGMSDYDQVKAAYDEYQRLLAASQTEQEKAIADARRQGRTEALTQAGGQLVEQWFKAAIGERLDKDRVNTILDGLDRTRFLTADGNVDTDKVRTYAESFLPAAPAAAPAATTVPEAGQQAPAAPAAPQSTAPPRGLDFGQGTPTQARPTGIEAGRQLARSRFGTKPATTPATS